MASTARFGVSFSIGPTNQERADAYALYHQAFGAKLISESTPPGGGDLHIMMDLQGISILIGPGSGDDADQKIVPEMRYQNEDEFWQAYHALIQGARKVSLEGPYPWADHLALITDQFGIFWALYYNKA